MQPVNSLTVDTKRSRDHKGAPMSAYKSTTIERCLTLAGGKLEVTNDCCSRLIQCISKDVLRAVLISSSGGLKLPRFLVLTNYNLHWIIYFVLHGIIMM